MSKAQIDQQTNGFENIQFIINKTLKEEPEATYIDLSDQ